MNNIHPKGISFKKYLFTLMITSAISTTAFANGSFIGLGNSDGGDFYRSTPADVSNDGLVVVGTNYYTDSNDKKAFRWTLNEGMQSYNLGSSAGAISGNGLITVGSNGTTPQVWGSASINESILGERADYDGIATDINHDGTAIIGRGYFSSYWMWTPNQGMEKLFFNPQGISGDGSTLIGDSRGDVFYERTSTNGGRTFLEDGDNYSISTDINYDGSVIVGRSFKSSGEHIFFRWDSATGMIELGEAGSPFGGGSVYVNGDGSVIAGSTVLAKSTRDDNFIWTKETGRVAFEDWLDSAGVDYSSFTSLTRITGLSSDGNTIIGYGINAAGNTEGFIATVPEPKSYAILLTGLGVLCLKLRKQKPSVE